MRSLLGWLVVMLCCAADAAGGATPPDTRLREAQADLDAAESSREAGRYSEALARGEHALALREAVLGASHPDVARCLELLGGLHLRQGDSARAEPLLVRALAIREAALGKEDPEVADSLYGLAALYVDQGLHARARPLFQRALAIREAALGKDSSDVAESLTQLARLSLTQRLNARAEPLLVRALALREAELGRDHPLVADSLADLGGFYEEQGLYGRAEPLLERALAIREAVLGKDHPRVAEALLPLGHLYVAQGFYDRAEPLFQRALAIREAASDESRPRFAWTLITLGNLYRAQGRYDRAEPLLQRALTILETVCGKRHPLVADALTALANLYRDQGAYRLAGPLYERALAIGKAALGENHPGVATLLGSLGDLASAQGAYARAAPLYERALAIREATLDRNHPSIAETLNHLAVARVAQHRLDAAVPLFTRAFALSERRLRQESLGFSEARLARFLQVLRADEERLYALLRAHPDDARVRRLALGAALLLKGRSVEETAEISRTVYRSLGAQDRDTFARLRESRTQLAQLSLEGPGSLPPDVYRQRLEALSEQGAALEAELAQRSAPLRALASLPPPTEVVDRVASALPGDGALVEIVTCSDRPLVLEPGALAASSPGSMRYLALVLFPDASVRVVDLGPAGPIDSAASRLRDALANRDASFQASALALYQLAFQPLLPLLGNARRLFLSLDGQLALVPFAALHDGQRFLVDSFDFIYLPSGTALLPRPAAPAPPRSVVVLADPDFGAPLQEGVGSGSRFFSLLRADLEARAWVPTPLPGSRQEAESIKRLLPQAELFLGADATKERLLHLPPPGVLHLATHGFFLEDAPALPASRAVAHFGELAEETVAPSTPDPLLRSGLVFAGARAPSSADASPGAPPPGSGLVTALELAGLDLWGTQLVVLSACDTGRGDVRLGQGVYGLRRAFLVAGAETVVMSLWKVNDATTHTLMEAYYRHLLAGQGRATALREAMLELRRTLPHPHSWAPFIAMGRDTPLRLGAPGSQNERPERGARP